MFSLSTLYFKTADWSLTMQIKQWKGMLFSVEQAFVGRDEIQAPLKMPAWEANFIKDELLKQGSLLMNFG